MTDAPSITDEPVTPPAASTSPAAEAADDDEPPDFATAIYGSLLVTSLVAVQWRHEPSVEAIGLSLLFAVFVFWLAHAWSRIVNQRVRGPISGRHALAIAKAETPLLIAAIPPTLVLALGRFPQLSTDQVVAAALIVCIGQLFVWGIVVGRAAHSSWALALRVAIVDSLLGIVIVGLKVAVLH
jgi:hypothetical protein